MASMLARRALDAIGLESKMLGERHCEVSDRATRQNLPSRRCRVRGPSTAEHPGHSSGVYPLAYRRRGC